MKFGRWIRKRENIERTDCTRPFHIADEGIWSISIRSAPCSPLCNQLHPPAKQILHHTCTPIPLRTHPHPLALLFRPIVISREHSVFVDQSIPPFIFPINLQRLLDANNAPRSTITSPPSPESPVPNPLNPRPTTLTHETRATSSLRRAAPSIDT